MPKDWLLFINADADELITRLVSPKEDLRGMAIENERGFQKLDGIEDLVGSHFR